jgi:hypothetical protein
MRREASKKQKKRQCGAKGWLNNRKSCGAMFNLLILLIA